MRIKFVRVDEIDRKKLALNLAKLSQKRTGKRRKSRRSSCQNGNS